MSRADFSKIIELIELKARIEARGEEMDMQFSEKDEELATQKKAIQDINSRIIKFRNEINKFKMNSNEARDHFFKRKKNKEQEIKELRAELGKLKIECAEKGIDF